MMPLHWMGNRLLSLVTNVLYSSTLSDMETCYKLFDAQVLEGLTIVSNRFDFEPEITAKVLRRGHRIYEVPDLLRRPRARRGEEDHLARRLQRHAGAGQVPLHPGVLSAGCPARIGAVVVDHDAGPLLEGCVRSLLEDGAPPGRGGGERCAPGSAAAALEELPGGPQARPCASCGPAATSASAPE